MLQRLVTPTSLALLAFAALAMPPPVAHAQDITLQSDDGDFDQFWQLTSPAAGPGDWIGIGYVSPLEFPFQVVSATQHYADSYCCRNGACVDADCGSFDDWERRVIASANLTVDPAGLTPDLTNTLVSESNVDVSAPVGTTSLTLPWTLTPNVWTLPNNTVFDRPGRVFYATNYFNGDTFMRFATDSTAGHMPLYDGVGINTTDDFGTRASVWSFGRVGMRITIRPVFFFKTAASQPQDSFQLANTANVSMLGLRIRGSENNTVVNTVTVRAAGTGHDANDISELRLVHDIGGDGVADPTDPVLALSNFTTDNGTATFTVGRTLAVGTTEEWLVVYDLGLTAQGGDTFAASIAQADVVSSVGNPWMSGTTNGSGVLTGPTVTIAGRLVASVGTANPAAQVVSDGAAGHETLQLRLTADNEAFDISALTFDASGTLDDVTRISDVAVWSDVDNNGIISAGDTLLGNGTFGTDDGGVRLAFSSAVTVSLGASRNFVVAYDLAAGAQGGDNFRTLLSQPTSIEGTGAVSGTLATVGPRAPVGTPVIGELHTIGGALTAAVGSAQGPATTQPGAANVPVLQFTLTAAAEAVDLTTISFESTGTGNESTDIQSVRLVRETTVNGVIDAGELDVGLPQSFSVDNGVVTFAVAGESVPAGATRTYLVAFTMSAAPTGGETFRARLNDAGDIAARGASSGATITTTGNFALLGQPLTVLGGLSVALGANNPAASNAQPGTTDLAMLQLSVSAEGETFSVSQLTVAASGSLDDGASVTQVRLYRDLGQPGVLDAADLLLSSGSYAIDDAQLDFTLSPPVVLAPSSLQDWLVVYDLAAAAPAGRTFVASAVAMNATGTLSGPATVQGLPVASNTFGIGGGLTISDGPAQPAGRVISPSEADVVLWQGRLQPDIEPVTITTITLEASGTGNDLVDISGVSLWVDTNNNGTLERLADTALGAPTAFSQNDGLATFTFAGRTISAGASESWILAADFAGTANAGDTFSAGFTNPNGLTATAPSGPLPTVVGTPVNGGSFTVLGSLNAALATNNPAAQTVRRDANNVPVMQVSLTANQEDFVIGSLAVSASGSVNDVTDLNGLSLYSDSNADGVLDAGDVLLAGPTPFAGDDGTLTFTGLSRSLTNGLTDTFLIVADFSGSAAGNGTLLLNVAAGGITATGFGGRNAPAAGLPLSSQPLTVGGTLDVGLGNSSPLGQVVLQGATQVPALQLRMAASTEAATIQSINLTASGTGNDALGLSAVQLWLDLNGDGVVSGGEPMLASQTFAADNGQLTFAISQAILPGPAVNLLVTFDVSAQPFGGDTFEVSLAPTSDVQISSASNAVVVTGGPLTGGLFTVGGGFTVAAGPQNPSGALVNQAAQNIALMQLELQAVNDACTATGLTLRATGSIDDAVDVSRVQIYVDQDNDGLVGPADLALGAAQTYAADDARVTLSGLNRAFAANQSERWLVVYDLAGSASNTESFGVRLEANADLQVSCTVGGVVTPSGAPLDSGTFTIQEDGSLIISLGQNSPPARFHAAGVVRAAALQLRVAASVQPLTLEELTLTASVSDASAVALVSLFRDENRDGLLDRSDPLLHAGGLPDAQGRVRFDALALAIPLDEAQFLLAAIDLAPNAPSGAQVQLGVASNADATANSGFGPAVITGAPITSSVLTVAGALDVSAGRAPATRNIANDAQGEVALDLALDANFEPFEIQRITISGAGTLEPSDTITALSLVVDENADGVADAAETRLATGVTFSQGSRRATFDNLTYTVQPGTQGRLLVLVDLDGSGRVDQSLTLSLAANVDLVAEGAQLGSTNPAGAPVSGDTLIVGGSLTIALGEAHPMDDVVSADADGVPAMQFVASASNEDVTLSRISLTAVGTLDDATGIDAVHLMWDANGDGLVDPGDVEVSPAARPAGNDGAVTFGPLSETIVKNDSRRFLVSVDLSGNGQAGQDVRFDLASDADVTAFGTNSGAVASRGAPLTGARLSLIGGLNVRRGPSTPPGVGVRPGQTFVAFQFELFTRGEAITIADLSVDLSGSTDDAAAIRQVRLFEDRRGDGLVAEDAVPLATNTVAADDDSVALENLGLTIAEDDSLLLIVELELEDDAPMGGDLRVGIDDAASIVASGAQSGPIVAVGTPVAGSSFTIVRGNEPMGPEPEEDEGCSCSAGKTQTDSEPPFLGLLLLAGFFVRRRARRPLTPKSE